MIGKRIHSYDINAHLGQGGMGNVFRATDNMLGREVALKVLHPELTIQPQFLERFKKEARLLAQLLHPNIAVIYNFFEQEGNHFMVMEYVDGTTLDDLLKKHKALPAEFVVPVFIQALEGLHHAHRKNILHRDIKPANLMLSTDGLLKVMDFGIAKIAGEQKMTQVNKIVGTIEFMAPELIEGKDASTASDIYSMGATLYELVSGKVPFEGDTDFNIMQAILKSKLTTPEKLNHSVPKALGDIIVKAMDRNPANRYPTAKAFQQALIASFPRLTEIDLNVLKKAENVAAKQTVISPLTTWVDTSTTVPKVALSKQLSNFLFYKQQVQSNKKLLMIIPGVLLVMMLIFFITGNKKDGLEKPPVAQDSIKQSVPYNAVVNNTGSNEVSPSLPPVSPPVLQDDKRLTVIDEPVIVEDVKPVKKEPLKKIKKEDIPVQADLVVEKTEAEPVPVKTVPEVKDVQLKNDVTIRLALKSSPDMHETKKTEQQVSFSVIEPVYYGGVLIIRQGAIARGSLMIGSRRTDIKIDRVEAANGSFISIKSENAHGRRDDIEEKKTFAAVIRQGTSIRF